MNQLKHRIHLLDSFRALAILSVMLFHYYHRWTDAYPYLDHYDYFSWGYYGVPLFFTISGFVIFYTLEKTANMRLFWKKRLIRLYPSMIIASILIFILLRLFDSNNIFPDGKKTENFIQSLTFLPPRLFTVLFHIKGISYLNSSFWSLWPEIQFYLLASCIYFANRKRFVVNFLIATLLMIVLNTILKVYVNHSDAGTITGQSILFLDKIFRHLNITDFILYFSAGVIFSAMFKNKAEQRPNHPLLVGSLIVIIFLQLFGLIGDGALIVAINALVFILFLLFIYFPRSISFLNNKLLIKVGLSSYFLYLIHEPLGVLSINLLGGYFNQAALLFPIVVMIILTTFSFIYYEKVEQKIIRLLKSEGKKKVNVVISE